MADALRFSQERFAALQLLLSVLPVVNVSQQHVPAGDTTFRVSRGESARLEPAVRAIGPTLTMLILIRLPGFDRAPPRIDHARKVIRMDSVADGPILQFLSRLAEVVQDLAVEKFDFARGLKVHTNPGMVSMIRRRLFSLARMAASLRWRSE